MLYSVFAAIRGELLKQEDQEKYQVLRLMANALSISGLPSRWRFCSLGFLKHRFAVNGNVKKLSIAFKPSQKYLIETLRLQHYQKFVQQRSKIHHQRFHISGQQREVALDSTALVNFLNNN
jgi:hypothetical protein